jgi:hypothetical protein
MQLQKRIYLGKKGYQFLKSIGVSASQIRELKQLDTGVSISIYPELQRLQQAALKPVSQQPAQH